MGPFDLLKAKLKKYPELEIIERDNWLTVEARSDKGFDVSILCEEEEYIVFLASSWHEHFDNSQLESALNLFAFALSDSCRIKQYSKNGKPYKWQLESKKDGEWVVDSTTGLISINFWSKPEITYLQNNIVRL